MIKEAIGTASTVEEAKALAIQELGAPVDADIKIEVLEQPSKKVFGLFGGSPAKVKASYEEPEKINAVSYLENILKNLGIENAKINVEESDEEVKIAVEYDGDYGTAIGRRGETLDAIQYLVRLVINRGSEQTKRVALNIGNYREKREATLRALAKKNAAKVKKYGRNVVLDPMNPYERRIIHTSIQEIEGVNSHSVGSENERKVVITLADDFKPTNPSRRNNRGYQNRDYNRGPKRDSRPRSTVPSRPPRSDAASTSRYGKIEPKNKG